jgi:hypothetical protein
LRGFLRFWRSIPAATATYGIIGDTMKESSPAFTSIPREQLLAARQADLAAYLIARGEPLIPSGPNRYKHRDHNSLVITGNAYYWNSRQEHGNAIDFLQSFYGLSFREAVEVLTDGAGKNIDVSPPAAPECFDFAQIELAPDMQRVIDYLHHQRGLSVELITELIRHRQLFQEAQTNNAIFPIYEGTEIVGAEVQGTLSHKRFKGIKTGSKYGHGYNLTFGDNPAFALFFESAIDLLSFVDLSHMRGKGLEGCRLTSLMGLKPNIVDQTLAQLPTARPVLCVDNDPAGASFVQTVQAANAGVMVRQPDPAYKDWNDQLRAVRAGAGL